MTIAPLQMALAAAAGAAPDGPAAFFISMFPLLLIFAIFYFLMIRPQSRKMKAHQAELMAIKKGDDIITGGGIRGRVTKVTDDEAEVEIAPNVKIRVIKSTISTVVKPKTKPAND
ncbi:MAG: preprotein translocase subunit YajC [Pseudomonadota bacterium]